MALLLPLVVAHLAPKVVPSLVPRLVTIVAYYLKHLGAYHKSNIWGQCTWACGRGFRHLVTMETKTESQIITNI